MENKDFKKKLNEENYFIKLGDVIDLQSGIAFKKSEYSKNGIRLFQIANVSFNYIKWDEIEHLPESYASKYPELLLVPGDIVMALNRPLLNDKLKISKIKISDTPAILYQRVGRFKFLNGEDRTYFLYFLQSPIFIKWLKEQLQGVNIPFINKLKLLSFDKYPKRVLKDQQSIVSKIEELFSELDKGIENLRIAQQQLKIYRQAILKWAFEGKLTNENVKNGLLPKAWKMVQIRDVSEMNPKIPNRDNIDRQMEVQFLPMKLVKEIINKINLTEIKKYEDVLKGSYTPFINGDVIFAKVTPCMENGKIAIVNNLKNGIGFGSSEFHVIRAGSKIIPAFIFYYLVQDKFRHEAANEMTGAVGLRRVPKQFIENHDIPLPPIIEQNKIVEELESRLSVADKMEESITQSLQQAEALR